MKKFLAGVMALVLSLSTLSGCSGAPEGGSTPAEGSDYEKVSLKLSCNGTEVANDTKAAMIFADLVNEKSGGAVTIQVFPNDQLGSGNQQKGLELLINGTVDLDMHSTSIISGLDSRLMASTMPWVFADYQAAEDAFFGEGGEFIQSVIEPKGLVYIGAVHNGFKAMTNSKHPIQTPEDLAGLKMRIPGGDFFSSFYSTFGASPQALTWTEVFTALQQGTVDGHDNSFSTINSANIQEVQKYISVSNHAYEAFTFMANQKKFDALSENTQTLIRECAEEACKTMNKQIVADEEGIIQKFIDENGCEIYRFTEEDMAAFKEVVTPLIEEYKGIYGEDACAAFGIK